MRNLSAYGHFHPEVNQNLTRKVKIKEPVSLLIFNEIIEVIHTKHKTKAMKIIRFFFVVDFPHFLQKMLGLYCPSFWTDITSQQVSACKVMAMNFNKIGHAFASAMQIFYFGSSFSAIMTQCVTKLTAIVGMLWWTFS